MKKILLFSILLFQLTFVFGQKDCVEKGCGDGLPIITRCWGAPRTFPDFPGVTVRVKGPIKDCFNAINNDVNKKSYLWYVEIKGTPNCLLDVTANVLFDNWFELGSGTQSNHLMPSEITQQDISESNKRYAQGVFKDFHTFSNSETIDIKLYKNYSTFKKTGKTNAESTLFPANSNGRTSSVNTSNQQTTQQNDLSEYNRSKAELERQVAERNAEGQRKSQNYTTAINAGISAHNSGNYAEAKNQFSIALNNCNTEEARAKAQEYYNKSIEAEKSHAKIKMTGDLIQVGIKGAYGIADAIKANSELKEKREAEKKARLIEYRQKKQEEKIAKEEEEKIKFEELLTQAENGSFDAQYEIAKKYGKDEEKFRSSLYFYKMAYYNPNKQLSEEFLVGYTNKLQQAGRIRDLYDILTNSEYIAKYPLVKLKSAFYNIFLENYFFWPSFFEGSNGVQEGINQLKELLIQKTDDLPSLLYAYMQVTGMYEKFGIPLNEKEGLKCLNKSENLLANYYLGLIYLKGTITIEKNENKSKEFFLKCINVKPKSAKQYGFRITPYETDYKYSIYSPKILSFIELAKINENEKIENGITLPNKIFENFPNKYASFIPSNELGFISKYVPNLFNIRELNIFGLDVDKTDRFRLPNFPENNSIGIILVNYPLNKCSSCLEQYQTLKKINGIIFLTIQVATEFDIIEEQSNDIYYFEGGEKRTSTFSGSVESMTYSKRGKMSNDAVIYTNIKEFDVNKLNEKGILPAIYFYKNNELKHVQTGFTDEKKINEIISKLK